MSVDVQLMIRPFHPTDDDYNTLIQMNRFRNPDEPLPAWTFYEKPV